MKYLVLLIVVVVAIGIWRSRRAPDAAVQKPPTPPRVALPQDMPACAHCGTHIPKAAPLMLGNQAYCCAEHRRLGPA